MINSWQHYHPVRILSGPLSETLNNALHKAMPDNKLDANILVVTSPSFKRRGKVQEISHILGTSRLIVIDYVTANPDISQIDEWLQQLAGKQISAVIGLGGGSALDAAKTLALLQPIANPHVSVLHELLCLKTLTQPCSRLPLLLIPTTAGTGSEVTPFATIWDREHKKKYSLHGNTIYPDAALLDYTLTLSLPGSETLYSGLDALSHCLESLWNINRTPMSEAYARHAIRLLTKHFPAAIASPEFSQSRQSMQTASLLAGMAISITRTAIAHSISYPLTSYYGVPHGLSCSFTLNSLIELALAEQSLSDLSEPFHQAKSLLATLPLRQHLYQYVTKEQVLQHSAEMFHPDRAGNFVVAFNHDILLEILEDSLRSD